MKTYENYFDELPWESASNPFAVPRTVPGGWDLTELANGVSHTNQLAAPETGDSPSQFPANSEPGCQADKFAEPRTIPARWDTSAF